MRILNAEQMREADRRTIEDIGIPSIVLMENAGRQVVAAIEAAFEDLNEMRVGVLCGRGNNGGDGFVVARTLVERGVDATVFLIARVADVRGDARLNLEILGRLGITVVEVATAEEWELHSSEILQCDLIVDAIFGTGFRGPLTGFLETLAADLNGADVPVVAIDLPSGMAADTAELDGEPIQATLTVTLAAPKLPLVLPPADRRAGDLVIADIGIPARVIDEIEGARLELLTREVVRPLIQPRPLDSHKGDFGRVLVVAGSFGKAGAAQLAAAGALRSGAGLVTVATPRTCVPMVAGWTPEYMTEPLAETPEGTIDATAVDRILELRADVIAVGPGLGRGAGPTKFMHDLLERASMPLVIDADGLNAFAGDPGRLQGRDGVDVILTPHPGEMARLAGTTVEELQANRLEIARTFATTHHVYLVLKGHRTLIASPEGAVYVNMTGNPGMASGGTGDVLTGMLAAWLAQLLDPEAACRVAVFLHGLAGDLAEAEKGQVALTATDLVGHLGDAALQLTGERGATAQD